jgi:hypothetical protein
MRIVGQWLVGNDGVHRPTVLIEVGGAGGILIQEYFLVDCGADSSALSAALLPKLNLPTQPPPSGLSLQGISGSSQFVVVATRLELPRDDGGVATIHGRFPALTNLAATDLSILGRDVLDHFDAIISRRRDQVVLLAGNHQYQVTP